MGHTQKRNHDSGWEEPAVLFVFFLEDAFFDCHILKLIGIKDFAAVQALDIFNVLFACYNANLGVFAGRVHGVGR